MVLDQHILERRGSETRLRALVDSNVVGIVSGDMLRIEEANDAFLNMVGLDRDALAEGVDYPAITAPEYSNADERAVAQADATGRFGPYEKEFVHRDGRRVPVRVVGTVLSTENRVRWMAIVEDLSLDRAVQAELRANESRYRSLAEATNTIVWSSDAAGRFVEPNPSWTAYTGQTDADARDHGWVKALHPDDRAWVFAALDDARAGRRPWTGRARLHHAASNSERHIEVRAVPLLDETGTVYEWVGTVSDIEEQTRTEQVLRATTARLGALMRNAPVGFAFIDDRLRFQVVNDKLAEINGLPAEAHLGRDVREVVPGLADESESIFAHVLAGEPVLDSAITGASPAAPGIQRDWIVNYYPVRDPAGMILGIGVTVLDVTEQVRRERDANLIARVTELVGTEDDLDTILEHIVALAVPLFCDACAMFVLEKDELRLRAVAHTDPQRAVEMKQYLAEPLVIAESLAASIVILHGETILLTEVGEDFYQPEFHPFQSPWMRETFAPRSALGIPLRINDRVTGLLAFFQTPESTRAFTDDDVAVANDLASRCGLVLDQVIAHQATRRARDRADRLQRFAASAARSAGVDAVVQAIATDGVAAVDAHVVNIAMRTDQDAPARFVQTRRLNPTDGLTWDAVTPDANDALTTVLRTGRPHYSSTAQAYDAAYPGSAPLLELNHARAVACLPLLDSDGQVLGAIGYTFRSEQDFTDDQRVLLETVADVAAQSLDRARLYERERDVAGALQLALLPAALPELDNVLTEARYIAGGQGVSVGGDWYDVLRFIDGRVGLLIGDAAGRGVEAATLMGKVRHAAAALAMDHESPAVVLARVNEFLHTISTRRDMVTCCYVVLDNDRGVLRYASAGHPPPVVVEDGHEPRFLDGGRGVPLGVIPTAAYSEATYSLSAPASIVLYTDGLIERRGETIDVGLERLIKAAGGHRGDIASLCNLLTTTLLAPGCEDDVALLVTRVCAVPTRDRLDLELPADSRRLQELRTRVTRWLTDAGVPPALIPEVVIALNEAASNSMVHAYAGAARRGHVRVSLALADSSLTATVSDEGNWRDKGPSHDGRGLEMMHALMNAVEVERDANGTRVTLTREMSA
ncbi:MAG TPA: SpoIIE family protein phosphatase, partial [Acidimicrobiia bacterium]|nr:SpoIIE family protein phosphatase [Acidimicrobiia bacterium]